MVLLPVAARADTYARIDADGKPQFSSYPAKGYELFMKSPPGTLPDGSGDPAWDRDAPYAKLVRAVAQATSVQAELIHAVINVESNYQPAARSPAGAVGLMQLMPDTAKRYSVRNRLDPQQNIDGGARYLRDLMFLFQNNLTLVLAAYNAGENAVAKHGNRIPPFSETRAYVPKVIAQYQKLLRASAGSVQTQGRVSRVFAAPAPRNGSGDPGTY